MVLVVAFIIAVVAWRHREAIERRRARFDALAIRSGLTPEERRLFETFYVDLPPQTQDVLLGDRTRFWQLLFHFSRAQMRTHPHELLRLMNKLFPAGLFHFPITSLDDIQPGELLVVHLAAQNLLARVERVDRPGRRISLALSNRSLEVHDATRASLYFYRKGAGSSQLQGSLLAASPGHTVFELEGDRIETRDTPRMMAHIGLRFSLSASTPPAIPSHSQPDQGSSGRTSTAVLQQPVVAREIVLTGRTEFISDRAFLIEIDPTTPMT